MTGPLRSLRGVAHVALVVVFSTPAFGDVPGMRDPRLLDVSRYEYLDQNWTEADRHWFYHIDQGSRLLPYDLFLALERPDAATSFSDPDYLLGFGALPSPATEGNPDVLPIGFTVNRSFGEPALGLTCAACHTQAVIHRDRVTIVDGGQAMFDLAALHGALIETLEATLADPAKLERTARALGVDDAQAAATIRSALEARTRFARRNHSDVAYGFARLDAFGAIMNRALEIADPDNVANPSDAPISYPHLWDTPQHDYVEWNGLSQNSLVGALARNIGEVIGVFGEVDPQRRQWLFYDAGYDASVRVAHLRAIEKRVAKMTSPQWPSHFPAPDVGRVAEGRRHFETYCLRCHLDIDRTDPKRRIEVRMSTVEAAGTDPKMAANALGHRGRSGRFEGLPRFYVAGRPLAEEVPALYVVNHLMGGIVRHHPLTALRAQRDARALGHPEVPNPPKHVDGVRLDDGAQTTDAALYAYKARPLNGIWATAPYLHNGSVPNLRELLLPAHERSERFFIGSWVYDVDNVGYSTAAVPGAFEFDTTLPGNANSGHEYGTGSDGLPALDAGQRAALVEYLKTL